MDVRLACRALARFAISRLHCRPHRGHPKFSFSGPHKEPKPCSHPHVHPPCRCGQASGTPCLAAHWHSSTSTRRPIGARPGRLVGGMRALPRPPSVPAARHQSLERVPIGTWRARLGDHRQGRSQARPLAASIVIVAHLGPPRGGAMGERRRCGRVPQLLGPHLTFVT